MPADSTSKARLENLSETASCLLLPASCFLLPASCFLLPASCFLLPAYRLLIIIRQPPAGEGFGSRRERACGRRFGAHGLAFHAVVARRDALYIRLRFAVARHAIAGMDDCIFAGVVAGQHQADVAVELVEQIAQIARSAFDILLHVVNV